MARRHKPQSFRILAVGRDISLLSSGANLLTQAGYTTDLVLTIEDAVRRVIVRQYPLVIVSSTFSPDQQLAARAHLRQVDPGLPVLLLGSEHDTPAALLQAVAQRLRQKSIFPLGPGSAPQALGRDVE